MPIDPSIALGVRPPQFADPLQQYGNVLAIQNAGNKNALSQYTLARAKREDETQNALAAAYRDALTPDGRIDYNRLTQSLAGGAAATSIPGVIKGRQEEEKRALDSRNILSQIGERDLNAGIKAMGQYRDALGEVTNPQIAAQWLQAQYNDPLVGPVVSRMRPLSAAIAAIPSDPQGFQQWVQKSALGMDKFIEKNAPKINVENIGGTSNLIATPGLGGTPQVIRSTPTTATPGQIMADDRSREFNASARATAAAARDQVAATRENTQAQRGIQNASSIRDEQTKALKPIDEVQQKLTIAKQLLASSSPASDIQLQQALTDLFDNARATNLLFNANKNFGTLAGRATGLIGRMFTGQYTGQQRAEIRNLITDMEKNVISPTRSRVESHYKGIAEATGVNPALTQTPNFYSDQSSGSPQAEADAFLRGAANAKPR